MKEPPDFGKATGDVQTNFQEASQLLMTREALHEALERAGGEEEKRYYRRYIQKCNQALRERGVRNV